MAPLKDPSAGARAPLLSAGETLAGRFRIVARLGEGAIGEVYEATDLELEEQVAVKVLRPEISSDSEVIRRFKREIQLARKVTHPNVCRTFELFHHREGGHEIAFVTMELLRGETLEERLLRGGRMLPAEALPVAAQMAEGLHAAHQAGVVHRDFKSGNVMLVRAGEGEATRVVVTDFGLAWSSSVSASVTRTGTLVGSPAYMAPEQVKGEPVTPATDVYALGIVLYEMVTGSLPFSADTAVGTAIKRLREPPTLPRVHAPDLLPLWEEVILRCLESRPADRYATPLEVVHDLSAHRRSSAQVLRGALRRNRRSGAAAAAAALLAAAGVAGWLARDRLHPPPPPTPPPAAVSPAPARQAVAVLGFENLSRSPEVVAYIGASLTHMLPSELSAGNQLRAVPSEQVDRVRRDLGLTGGASLAHDTLAHLHTRLGADFVVSGSYFADPSPGRSAGKIRCDVAVQDARSGELVASFKQEGTEDEILLLVSALGTQLRDRLGARDLSAAERLAAQASRPASAQAARLYAEGIEKLARFETLEARGLLEEARRADPGSPLIRAELAAAWSALGDKARAADEARQAVARAASLGVESRSRVQGLFYETSWQWDEAAAIYRQLWERFPDDIEHGLALARVQIQTGASRDALATVAGMRRRPSPAGEDPRIDLAEAEALLRVSDYERGIAAAAAAERKGKEQRAPLIAARALHFRAIGLWRLGRLPQALATAEQAIGTFREAGDLASAALSLNTRGAVQAQLGDLGGARRTYEEVVGIGMAIGSEETRGMGLANLGTALSGAGDLAAARQSYEEALAMFRRTGSKLREAAASGSLARLYQRLGKRAEARAMLGSAAAAFRAAGDRSNEARALANLADMSIEEGDLRPAWEQATRALSLHREIGEAAGVADAQGARGLVLALRGDLAAAGRELEAAAAGQEKLGAKPAAARQRVELARVLVEAGHAAQGEAMVRSALAAFGENPSPDDEVAARSVLAAAALAQGRREDAAAEVARTASPLAACGNRTVQLQAAVTSARVRAAGGQRREAAAELRAAAQEAEELGLRPLALEARLALGEIELATAPAAGRERLAAVAKEAAAAGLGSIARRARPTS